MIIINKSKTADSRTCDVSNVTKSDLLIATNQHIGDVQKGFIFFIDKITKAAIRHDETKISHIDWFHENFQTKFEKRDWLDFHKKAERHHFNEEGFIKEDVNLIDVLEQIIDGVMAGMARSGEYRQEPIPSWLLEKAYNNTVKMLLNEVIVADIKDGY